VKFSLEKLITVNITPTGKKDSDRNRPDYIVQKVKIKKTKPNTLQKFVDNYPRKMY